MGGYDSEAVFCFADFELDPHSGELRRRNERVSLQEQPLQILHVLLQEAGRLVRREELRQRVWPENTFVEFDQALNTAVKKIRVALGDCADTPCYVETIPKRGYRFIAPVMVKGGAEDIVEPRPQVPIQKRIALGAALAALLFVCAGLLGIRWRTEASAAAAKPDVMAVLPLQDLSDNASQSALCDGLGDELTMQLGQMDQKRVAVTSRAAALSYRDTNKTVAEVARELRAAYLLAGNVRGDARRVRVTVELIRTGDQLQIWGESFDRETGDRLTLERELSTDVAQRVQTALVSESTRKR
ncbi:MAG TPA: winged helix-turn-helix domain-containing protein [Terriglobales bacterium]|nr:winged helix-turn-helix domain-containing protein [Terriglobales bacterium]